MKAGLPDVNSLARELQRQRDAKRDFVAPAAQLKLVRADASAEASVLTLNAGNGFEDFPVNDLAHGQIAGKLGIPKVYYDRMKSEMPELLRTNVNSWLGGSSARYLVRTLDGNARAFLSDRYRTIDNYDVAEVVLPILHKNNLIVRSSQITEQRMYLKAVSPDVERTVALIKPGTHERVNEVINFGFCIRNSEVGCGSFAVESFYEVLRCTNGARGQDLLSKFHSGSRMEGGEGAWEVFGNDTRATTDKALMMQVRDLTNAAISYEYVDRVVEAIQRASGIEVPARHVTQVVEVVGKDFGLRENERAGVLEHLIAGGDLTQWGVVSAVTRSAQDASDYDRASELEAIGHAVLELSPVKWDKVLTTAVTLN